MRKTIQKGVNDLSTWCEQNGRMDLLMEWDYEKNNPITPEDVTAGSNTSFWWKDKLGHSWSMRVYSRSNQHQKCPYCSGRKVLKGFNDLLTVNPVVAKEWHPTRNGKLSPSDFTEKSKKMVWWKGKCGHEWQAIIKSRSNNHGCPYCTNRKVLSGFNDLQTRNPEIASEWNSEKNGDLSPDKVCLSSKKTVWWKCAEGHEWQTVISSRAKGSGCPVCSRKRVVTGYNDLATLNPEIASEWDYEKNGKLTPNQVALKTHTKVWWKGYCGHSWYQAISERTSARGCPKCSKEQRSSFPEQAILYYIKQLYPDVVNNDRHLKIELDIYIPSLAFAVEYDGIAWHKNIERDLRKNRICQNNGIKLIRIREQGLGILNDCICIQRRDNHSDESLDESIKATIKILDKNNSVDVDVSSDRTYIFSQYISKRKENSLLLLYPDVSKEWHSYKNGELTPLMVTSKSGKKVWWTCKVCGFDWQTSINNRTNGHGCPACAIKKLIKNSRETRMKNRKSFIAISRKRQTMRLT